MRSLRVQLDEPTYRALSEIAPGGGRGPVQFIREAIRKAVREAEYAQIRKAYEAQPDSESEADDWSAARPFS
jgi:predicted transcriptional regulator